MRIQYDPHFDYYQLLGVDPQADNATIQRAYRQKAKEWHPDLNPGDDAKERFQRLSEAYSILSDAEKRKQYNGVRWRFTSYETFSEETYSRASQWHESRWEEAFSPRPKTQRVYVQQEPGQWLSDIGLDFLRPAYKALIGLLGSPYRYILLFLATAVVLNGLFIVAGLVFADNRLFVQENNAPTSEAIPSPTIINTQPALSRALPTREAVPSVTPPTRRLNCDPRTTFDLPVEGRPIGQLYGTITHPDAVRYEVRAYPLDFEGDYIVIGSGTVQRTLIHAPLGNLEALQEGRFRLALRVTLHDEVTIASCDITIE